jgi:ribA/ribD-fused uncharacterized protein
MDATFRLVNTQCSESLSIPKHHDVLVVSVNKNRAQIRFFNPAHQYGEFSNYFKRIMIIDGKKYASNEHWYNSNKYVTVDAAFAEKIRLQSTAHQAKQLARSHPQGKTIRVDWDAVKDGIMLKGLIAKFKQHKDLARLLIDTGDAELCESSFYDGYWGWGRDKKGQNKMGKLLMYVRSVLLQEQVEQADKREESVAESQSVVGHVSKKRKLNPELSTTAVFTLTVVPDADADADANADAVQTKKRKHVPRD